MTSRPLVPLILLTACVGGPAPVPSEAQRLRGVVEGLERPDHARVEVFRTTDAGIVERLHGAAVTPGADGTFATSPLLPGRYLLALRAGDRPVSVITLPVPPAPHARLVARRALGNASLELRHELPDVEELAVALTHTERGVPVTDRRAVAVRAGVTSLVRGLTPGRWQLDLVTGGATTELSVPEGAGTLTYTVSPPAVGAGAQMVGRVLREDGQPARSVAVTVRGFPEGAETPAEWGRYALTDSDGGYRLAGLSAGRALLRIECRDAVHRRVPRPEIITIPPSGVMRRSFVVGP